VSKLDRLSPFDAVRRFRARLPRFVGGALGLLLVLVATSCRTTQRPGPQGEVLGDSGVRTFQAVGVVQEIKPDRKEVVIKHGEIKGYMPAMTMPFDVKDTNLLAQINAGDKVAFQLRVTDKDGWIDKLTRIGTAPAPVVPSVRAVREVNELKEGELMTDYTFRNELGGTMKLSDFRGQAVGFTFFYTRCPYPTFCPRMSSNLAEASRRLSSHSLGATNWHLLSISFDPEHDTPATLRLYASRYGYDPARWNFLTGEIIDLDAITEQFGMYFARDGETFSHNVRTVILDTQGRIQRILVGNRWTVEEFVTEIEKAAAKSGQ